MQSDIKPGIILARRAIERADSGLYFVEEILMDRGKSTDAAYSRSWYILISYNFELILNALFCFENQGHSSKDVINAIMSLGAPHDFEKLSKAISPQLNKKIGISSVKKQNKVGFLEYKIIIDDQHEIFVQDLVDVRYDFKKDSKRKIDSNEIPRINNELKILRSIIGRIKELVWIREV